MSQERTTHFLNVGPLWEDSRREGGCVQGPKATRQHDASTRAPVLREEGRPRPSLRAAVGLGGTRALAEQSKVCVTSALTPQSREQRGTLPQENQSLPPRTCVTLSLPSLSLSFPT